MTKVIIDTFDGGIAEDIRTHNTNEFEESLNFDIFQNAHKLIPHTDSIAETIVTTYTMDDIEISDVDVATISGTNYIYGGGYKTDADTSATFWSKTSITSAFTSQGSTSGYTYVKGSLVSFRNKLYCLGFNGSTTYILYSFDSAGTVTGHGTISSSSTFRARPVVHPEDNILYICIGTTITRFNGTDDIGTSTTTSYTYTTILPTGKEVTSVTDSGSYLAIAMRPLRGTGNCTVYLWGRDGTINTLQGTVNFGEGNLVILENLNNILIGVMQPQIGFSVKTNRLIFKGYAGGAVEELKTINISVSQGAGLSKVKNGDKLYFSSGNDYAVYCFGKNKKGRYTITKDRYYYNSTIVSGNPPFLSMVGDVLWCGFYAGSPSAYVLTRSRTSTDGYAYTGVSSLKTTINPKMAIADRYSNKKLLSVRLAYTGKTSGTAVLKAIIDGGSPMTLINETTTAIEDAKESDTIAVATGSYIAGDQIGDGREFQFQVESTGGVEIKEISYNYQVLPTLN